jgi:hypothetical protein
MDETYIREMVRFIKAYDPAAAHDLDGEW